MHGRSSPLTCKPTCCLRACMHAVVCLLRVTLLLYCCVGGVVGRARLAVMGVSAALPHKPAPGPRHINAAADAASASASAPLTGAAVVLALSEDEEMLQRQWAVREAFVHAWKGYEACCCMCVLWVSNTACLHVCLCLCLCLWPCLLWLWLCAPPDTRSLLLAMTHWRQFHDEQPRMQLGWV